MAIKIASQDPKSRVYKKCVMPVMSIVDPEKAHRVAIWAARLGLVPRSTQDDPILHQTCWGYSFSNPVGLAAGFDKNGEAIEGMSRVGFGFIEIGSVCPKEQPGNPKPRVFRLPEDNAVINRYGFNSDGAELVASRIKKWRLKRTPQKEDAFPVILGINLGKNKITVNAVDDYVTGVNQLGALADYLVVNVSSPNTPNLRDLQQESVLKDLILKVQEARNHLDIQEGHKTPPLLIKIAPDLRDFEKEQIASVALSCAIDGIIVTNTTVERKLLKSASSDEVGGLSGRPLFDMSTEVLKDMYILTQGRIPLIGVGGIFSGEDALKKIESGASLVQLYTAMSIEGPGKITEIKEELALLLKQKGYKSVSDAVGKGTKMNEKQ